MPSHPVSIRLQDIAVKAGVSTMTVSRVLRKDPKVSPELRQKIQRIAQQLGYRANPLVSAFMSNRRARKPIHYDLKLGFITSFSTCDGWKQFRLYREFFTGAATKAEQHGYRLEEFWLDEPGMTPRRLNQILLTRNIHGVLVAPLPEPQGCIGLDLENLAAVAFGYSLSQPLHRVSNHQFRSMQLLMIKLRELGYRRPGLALSASLDGRVLHQWLGGFLIEQRVFTRQQVPPLMNEKWSGENF